MEMVGSGLHEHSRTGYHYLGLRGNVMTKGTVPDKQAMNRWSDKKLKAHGYRSHGLINVVDREEVHRFVEGKLSEGYHVVLKRECRGAYRRLYLKWIDPEVSVQIKRGS
jgi:hypothetical protein